MPQLTTFRIYTLEWFIPNTDAAYVVTNYGMIVFKVCILIKARATLIVTFLGDDVAHLIKLIETLYRATLY